MTVGEMIKLLQAFPPDMRLVRDGEWGDFYDANEPRHVKARLDARPPEDRSPTHIDPSHIDDFKNIPTSDAVAI